jgi:PAS domain S-box-containing protein
METLLNQLFIPDRIEYLFLNRDLIILEKSSQVEKFADLPNEVSIGKDVRLAFPEFIGSEEILEEILLLQRDNLTLEGIFREREDNSPIYGNLSVRCFQNHLIVLFDDVTEIMILKQSLIQRANESEFLLSALTVSQNYLNNIVISMGDALIVTTETGKIKTINLATEKLFEYSETELIDNYLSMILPNCELSFEEHRKNLQKSPTGFKSNECHCLTKSGQEIVVEFCCSAIKTEIKNTIDYVYIGRNITARKQAEAEIKIALEKEKELNELKSRFVAMTSHEFRNPLTSISICVDSLLTNDLNLSNQQQQDYLNYIKTSAQSMKNLLEDILIIGKAEAGKLTFQPLQLNLGIFCQNLLKELELTYLGRQIDFKCDICDRSFWLDEKLLKHILSNLISNAIKYSSPEKTINFQIEMEDNVLKFTIRDRGIGILPEDRKHLFESFHRGKNIGNIAGTGLGMSIVKKAVELHGGNITVNSQVERGTTIIVNLPIGIKDYERTS